MAVSSRDGGLQHGRIYPTRARGGGDRELHDLGRNAPRTAGQHLFFRVHLCVCVSVCLKRSEQGFPWSSRGYWRRSGLRDADNGPSASTQNCWLGRFMV